MDSNVTTPAIFLVKTRFATETNYMFEPGQIVRLLGGMVKKRDRIPADVLALIRGYQKDARERLLAALRTQRGLTQAQLAERLGVSQPHIAKLEAGRAKNIELHTLCRWATALRAKVTVDVVPNGTRKGKRTAA
jgi:DNA-binding XRE family transcriptional regulator